MKAFSQILAEKIGDPWGATAPIPSVDPPLEKQNQEADLPFSLRNPEAGSSIKPLRVKLKGSYPTTTNFSGDHKNCDNNTQASRGQPLKDRWGIKTQKTELGSLQESATLPRVRKPIVGHSFMKLSPKAQKAFQGLLSLGAILQKENLHRRGLKKEYRKLAKALHPDLASTTTNPFITLQKHYTALEKELQLLDATITDPSRGESL